MKIILTASHTKPYFDVMVPTGVLRKYKHHTFKLDKIKELLDFVLTVSDRYIESIPDAIYDYALQHKHPVLRKKNLCFI